jgi:hypothetical protein
VSVRVLILYVFCRQAEEKKTSSGEQRMAELDRKEAEDSEVDSEDGTTGSELTKRRTVKVEPHIPQVRDSTRTVSAADVEYRCASIVNEKMNWTSLLGQ